MSRNELLPATSLLIIALGISAQICPTVAAQPTSSTNEKAHELWTNANVKQFREDLTIFDSKVNKNSIDEFTKLIDLHSKYEDYITKSEGAQHPTIQAFGSVGTPVLSGVISLVTALITTFLTLRFSSK
jgi:hypothetical protein